MHYLQVNTQVKSTSLKKHLILITILAGVLPALFNQCARQTAPTGGPKDTIPPILIYTEPIRNSKSIKPEEITLTFDERIQLNSPKEEIIFNPPLSTEPEIIESKNQVKIKLTSQLKDSTTYVINFRDAIQDITEKNITSNLTYAFSTGSILDSLEITGNITDLQTSKPIKDVTIGIFNQDTSNFFNHPPYFLAKSDKEGNFKITNLKNQAFFLYAFNDKNRNFKVDSKNESYGFKMTKVLPAKTKYAIAITHMDTRPIKVQSSRPFNTYSIVRLNKQISTYTYTSEDSTLKSILDPDKTQLKFYSKLRPDSIPLRIITHDSLGNKSDTIINIKFNQTKTRPESINLNPLEHYYLLSHKELKAIININKPVTFAFDSIYLVSDSTGIIHLSKPFISTDSLSNNLTLKYTNLELPVLTKGRYQLKYGKGSIITIDKDSVKSFQKEIDFRGLDNTSIISFNIKSTSKYLLTQLLDDKGRLVSQSRETSSTFNDLKPGTYQLRVIEDRNQDLKWTTGNITKGLEPEGIKYYKNEKGLTAITVLENWEVGPLLITYE